MLLSKSVVSILLTCLRPSLALAKAERCDPDAAFRAQSVSAEPQSAGVMGLGQNQLRNSRAAEDNRVGGGRRERDGRRTTEQTSNLF